MPHKVIWLDRGREPQCPPDPRFPEGVHIKADAKVRCLVNLPYPAPRCGVWIVECKTCDTRIAITAAGRPDDPRTVEIPCYGSGWRE